MSCDQYKYIYYSILKGLQDFHFYLNEIIQTILLVKIGKRLHKQLRVYNIL